MSRTLSGLGTLDGAASPDQVFRGWPKSPWTKMILYLIRRKSGENCFATHWTIDLVVVGGVYTSSRPCLDVIANILSEPCQWQDFE